MPQERPNHIGHKLEKFVDFPVDARMIKDLWKVGKLTDMRCIQELILAKDKAPSHVYEVERTMALQYKLDCELWL